MVGQCLLIFDATDGEPYPFTAVVTGHIGKPPTYVAAPGIGRLILRRTPPGTILANVVECTKVVTAAAGKT